MTTTDAATMAVRRNKTSESEDPMAAANETAEEAVASTRTLITRPTVANIDTSDFLGASTSSSIPLASPVPDDNSVRSILARARAAALAAEKVLNDHKEYIETAVESNKLEEVLEEVAIVDEKKSPFEEISEKNIEESDEKLTNNFVPVMTDTDKEETAVKDAEIKTEEVPEIPLEEDAKETTELVEADKKGLDEVIQEEITKVEEPEVKSEVKPKEIFQTPGEEATEEEAEVVEDEVVVSDAVTEQDNTEKNIPKEAPPTPEEPPLNKEKLAMNNEIAEESLKGYTHEEESQEVDKLDQAPTEKNTEEINVHNEEISQKLNSEVAEVTKELSASVTITEVEEIWDMTEEEKTAASQETNPTESPKEEPATSPASEVVTEELPKSEDSVEKTAIESAACSFFSMLTLPNCEGADDNLVETVKLDGEEAVAADEKTAEIVKVEETAASDAATKEEKKASPPSTLECPTNDETSEKVTDAEIKAEKISLSETFIPDSEETKDKPDNIIEEQTTEENSGEVGLVNEDKALPVEPATKDTSPSSCPLVIPGHLKTEKMNPFYFCGSLTSI